MVRIWDILNSTKIHDITLVKFQFYKSINPHGQKPPHLQPIWSHDVPWFCLFQGSFLQGGAPPVISWFVIPINYRYITNKNHSYWSFVHQLSDSELGHHLVGTDSRQNPRSGRIAKQIPARPWKCCWVQRGEAKCFRFFFLQTWGFTWVKHGKTW